MSTKLILIILGCVLVGVYLYLTLSKTVLAPATPIVSASTGSPIQAATKSGAFSSAKLFPGLA